MRKLRLSIFVFVLVLGVFTLSAQNNVAIPDPPVFPEITNTKKDHLLVDSVLAYAWDVNSNAPDTAQVFAKYALGIAESCNYEKGIADAKHIIGVANWYKAYYELAAEYLFEALRIREKIGDQLGLGRSYNNIGLVLQDQGNYQEALDYFSKGLVIREKLNDYYGLVYSYNNIGEIHQVRGEYERSMNTYTYGLALAREWNQPRGESFLLHSIGSLFEVQNKPDSAEAYYFASLKIAKEIDHQDQQCSDLNSIARLWLKYDGDRYLDSIMVIATQSLNLAKQLNAQEEQLDAVQILARASAAANDYEEAYAYQQAYQVMHQRFLEETNDRAILEIQAQYETARQQAELLEKERQVDQLRLALIAALGILFLSLAISLIYRNRSERKLRKTLEQKNLEINAQNNALLRSNDTLEQFAYVASHDLKEPLRNIGSFASLLERRYLSELGRDGKEYINFIVDNVRQMYILLEDILTYSRLENVEAKDAELVNMNETVEQVWSSLQSGPNNVAARLQLTKLPWVQTNQTQMKQLVQNLLTNAIKFNESDQPQVHIEGDVQGKMAHFRVIDNGIGIDPVYREKIFQVFQRLQRGDYPGTGIGLAICARIVSQWDGKIWVEQSPQGGSIFCFSLPKAEAPKVTRKDKDKVETIQT